MCIRDRSFGDGTSDRPFSVDQCVKLINTTNIQIITKGVYNSTAEWGFKVASDDKLYFALYDESVADTYEFANTTATLTAYEGSWVHGCGTYNGVGGTSANGGVKLYINGASQALSLTGGGTYVAMENLAHDVWIGRYDSTYAKGQIDEVRVYSKELSATEVLTNYNNGKSAHSN